MPPFGEELRRLRMTSGLRQIDLVEALDHVIARSTLASVESGREAPSPRLWASIEKARPDWALALRPAFAEARSIVSPPAAAAGALTSLAGPFALEEARFVYTFREHHAPEEIVEVRRVRALKDGADAYVLRMSTDGPTSELDIEVLWGGHLTETAVRHHQGQTVFLNRLVLDHPLRKGDLYSFGVRSWLTKEDDPPEDVCLSYTIPIAEASLHLNFLGPVPAKVWRFGPLADSAFTRDPDVANAGALPLTEGRVSSYFFKPNLHAQYGIAWEW